MESGGKEPTYRAAPPRVPAATPAFERADEEHRAHFRERKALEQRSLLRALLLLAVAVLVASFARAGLARVFVHGWWKP
jgi:hypothetical protein